MRHSQQGMSTYTTIVFSMLLIFAGFFLFKIGMPILDNWTVKEVLESIAKDEEMRNLSSSDIRKFLQKKFDVNRIEHISVKDDIEITSENGVRTIIADYEARVPFIKNIDLVIRFESNRVAIGGSGN